MHKSVSCDNTSDNVSHFLPPFLQSWPEDPELQSRSKFNRSIFKHSSRLSYNSAETLYWPPLTKSNTAKSKSQIILLFIPGNPGLVDFYIPFLGALHIRCNETEGFPAQLSIIAKAHLGHSPRLFLSGINKTRSTRTDLISQVNSVIELYDSVRDYYSTMDSGPSKAKVILIGHSVGAWIALQTLKARIDADGLFLLFPTISNIAMTPNGRRFGWLFKSPFPLIISQISIATKLISDSTLKHLFKPWSASQIGVLRSLISSPPTIYSTLSMANEEMRAIKSLEDSGSVGQLLIDHSEKLWSYFAKKDDWVGEERENVVEMLQGKNKGDHVRIVHGQEGVPHSFCITHSELLAEQCAQWLFSHMHVSTK